MKDTLCPMGC